MGTIYTGGPESLLKYFQKVSLLGQKVAQHFWYVDRLFDGQSYLAYKIKKNILMFSIFYSHICIVGTFLVLGIL